MNQVSPYLLVHRFHLLFFRQVLPWKQKVNQVLLVLVCLYHNHLLLTLQALPEYLFHRLPHLRILRHQHIHLAQVSLSRVQKHLLFQLLHHHRHLYLVHLLRRNLIVSLLYNRLQYHRLLLFQLYHLKLLRGLCLRFLPRHQKFLTHPY